MEDRKRFRKEDYPLVVRVVNRHLVITSPDFKFPLPVVKPVNLDRPDLREIGAAVYMAYLQIEQAIRDRDLARVSLPCPTQPREVLPAELKTVSLTEACTRLGLKPDAVRALADSGKIQSLRTQGGHRRLLRSSIEEFASQSITGSQEA